MEDRAEAAVPSSSLEPLETSDRLSERWSAPQRRIHARWADTREFIIRALEDSKNEKHRRRAIRLSLCCCSPTVRVSDTGSPVLRLQACRDRMCPRCQLARGVALSERIHGLISRFDAPRFLTLTLTHREAPLWEEIDRLFAAFRRLRKLERWKKNARGGVYVLQVTKNASTGCWHPHLHLIVDGEFYAQAALSKDWEWASKGSSIVDIRTVPDRAKVAKYVAEYVAKPADVKAWNIADVREFASAMAGRRLVHTFGRVHNAQVHDRPADDDLPAEIKRTEHVCDAITLISWERRGDTDAGYARSVFARIGPAWHKAMGFAPLSPHSPIAPIEEWEIARALAIASEINRRPPGITLEEVHRTARYVERERQLSLIRTG